MSSITSRKKTTSKKNDRPKRVSAYNIFVSRRRKEITDEAQKKKEAEKIANAIQAALNANATGVKADGKEEGKSEEKEEKTTKSKPGSSQNNINFGVLMRQISDEWNNKISAKEKGKYEKIAANENLKLRREFNEQKLKEFEEMKRAKMKRRAEVEAAKLKNSNGKSKKSSKKKVSKKDSLETSSHWKTCWEPHKRKGAVLKGIQFIFKLAQDKENFDYFGNDIIQCFYDIAKVTGEPIRSQSLMFLEQVGNRWKDELTAEGWKEDKDGKPTVQEIINVVIGMYCLERIAISHKFKKEVMECVSIYNATDYYGWDPDTENAPTEKTQLPTEKRQLKSPYRIMSNALIHSFFAYKAGVVLGTSFVNVLKHLPEFRPYKGHDMLEWEDYFDQCYMITHVIFVLSNWGELSLDQNMFPHEYFFIIRNLPIHMYTGDIHLVSEFLECLRIFGTPDSSDLIQKGITLLLENQNVDGSWDSNKGTDAYTQYHATMCACQAMLAHRYCGYGPGIIEASKVLNEWHLKDVQLSIDLRDKPTETRGDEMETSFSALEEKIKMLEEEVKVKEVNRIEREKEEERLEIKREQQRKYRERVRKEKEIAEKAAAEKLAGKTPFTIAAGNKAATDTANSHNDTANNKKRKASTLTKEEISFSSNNELTKKSKTEVKPESSGFLVGEVVSDLDFTSSVTSSNNNDINNKRKKEKVKAPKLKRKASNKKKRSNKIELSKSEEPVFEKYEELVLKLKKLFRSDVSKAKKNIKKTLKAIAKESGKKDTTPNIILKSGISGLLNAYVTSDADKKDADIVKWVQGVQGLLTKYESGS